MKQRLIQKDQRLHQIYFCNASLVEFNEIYYYDGKQKNRSIKIFTIVEYNELEDKYYDIITGDEYVNYEYNSRLIS